MGGLMKSAIRKCSALGLFLAIVLTIPAVAGAARPPQDSATAHYHIVKKVVLGGEGGWDYLGFDAQNRHLFVSHGTQVLVIDPDTVRVVGNIPTPWRPRHCRRPGTQSRIHQRREKPTR